MNRGPPTRALTRFSKTINDQQSTINDQLSTVNDQAPATRLRGSLGPWGPGSSIIWPLFRPQRAPGDSQGAKMAPGFDLEELQKASKILKITN